MGPIDYGRRRAAELEAYHALWNLWRTSKQRMVVVSNWELACEMLHTHYTVGQARRDSEVCAMRIRYLEISEPAPQLADFVNTPPYYRVADAPRQLAQAHYDYQLARLRHPERERMRLKELETTKVLYKAVEAAEANAEIARRRRWQQSRWPKGVVLEAEIYNLDSVAAQVDQQNAKIGFQVAALNDLLEVGLQNLPEVSESHLTASYRAGDPAGIAAYVESVLHYRCRALSSQRPRLRILRMRASWWSSTSCPRLMSSRRPSRTDISRAETRLSRRRERRRK
jgi:restriction system protein